MTASTNALINRRNEITSKDDTTTARASRLRHIASPNELDGFRVIGVESLDDLVALTRDEAQDILPLMSGSGATAHAVVLVSSALYQKTGRVPPRVLEVRQLIRSHFGLSGSAIEIAVAERAVLRGLLDRSQQAENEYSIRSTYQEDLIEIITDALSRGGSDVHIEARKGVPSRIRVRLNGELVVRHDDCGYEYAYSLMQYIYNTLSHEGGVAFNARSQQDAVIPKLPLPRINKVVRLRVATTPTANDGHDMVLRILPLETLSEPKPLDAMGYTTRQAQQLLDAISLPQGLIVFAGTTGSGKSTSLANLLLLRAQQMEGRFKLITAENPVEYLLPGATQIPVVATELGDPQWAKAIRACLRLDPDMLMVGEIRDADSAELIRDAVQTGHPVLSTVHAGSSLVIIDRLVGLKIPRDVLASPDFMSLMAKQDLLQTVCPDCALEYAEVSRRPTLRKARLDVLSRLRLLTEHLDRVGVDVDVNNVRFQNPEGCEKCRHATPGIIGRTACAEIVTPDRTMREMFLDPAKRSELLAYWLTQYPRESQMDIAITKMFAGIVDPSAVERKLYSLDWVVKRDVDYGVGQCRQV